MNVSRPEQRTLHALAQGGHIAFLRGASSEVTRVECYNCDDRLLLDCTLVVFSRLRDKNLIRPRQGRPYRIPMAGLKAVRPQASNR